MTYSPETDKQLIGLQTTPAAAGSSDKKNKHPVKSTQKDQLKIVQELLKLGKDATIGSHKYDGGFDATSFTKGIDPQNLAGTVKWGLQIIEQLKGQGGPFQLMEGMLGGGIFGMMQQFSTLLHSGSSMLPQLESALTSALQTKNQNDQKNKPANTPQQLQQQLQDAEALVSSLMQQLQGGGIG